MKNFNYTARDKSGATKRGSLKAADRNEALHELTAQGLVPLSVNEGAVSDAGKGIKTLSPRRMIIFLIVGLALVAGVVVWMRMTAVKTANDKKPQKAVQAQRAFSRRSASMKTNGTGRATGGGDRDPLNSTQQGVQSVQTNHAKTLSDTNIVEASKEQKKPADYPSGLEQVMSWIVNKRLGDTPFFLPRLSPKENIVEILERDLIVYDDDTEAKVQAKANVAQAKQMLKEYMAQGGKPEEFLKYFHSALLDANREWKEAQKQVSTLMQTGDREAALVYAEEANKRLAEKGIKPVISPK
jgi:hypothetical protein